MSANGLQVRVEVAAALAALASGTATALYLGAPLVAAKGVERAAFATKDVGVVPGADALPADDGSAARPAPGAGLPADGERAAPVADGVPFVRAHPHHTAPLDPIAVDPAQIAAPPPPPTFLAIPRLGVHAPIAGVGVARNGELQLPPNGRTVVWYRYGATPGEDGSAVLAAHVDYDRRAGPFYRLRLLAVGDRVSVTLATGATRRFVVAARRVYAKPALPANFVFRSAGGPVLALVTCGGRFDYRARRYADNVVVYAVPA